MIEPSSRIDQALGIDLKKVYKSMSAASIRRPTTDQINISQFSALVEKARSKALNMPDIRLEKVEEARNDLIAGNRPSSGDIASAMIESSVDVRECE